MQNSTKTVEHQGFSGLLLANRRWFLGFTPATLALRLLFILRFPYITTDGVVYGNLAKNWLLYHVYGLGGGGAIVPTYIRLPGYPAFLAALWAVFGLEHYNAVRFAQAILDLGTCFVTADLARRAVGGRSQEAARWAFALTALCPLLANYTAVPLTETPAIFLAALALDCAVAGLQSDNGRALFWWASCGLAIAGGIYLRPDGGIILIVIGGYLLVRLALKPGKARTFWAGIVLAVCSLGPLLPWTARNFRVFHRFQPLAPAHANAPGEFYAAGFDRWMRTWLVDYASLEDVGFKLDSEDLDIGLLPARAFDSDQERNQTEALLSRYNETDTMTPELDEQFDSLARQRIQRHHLRYYFELPLLRAADLWLRPRTEMLPLGAHWWRFRDDPPDFAWAVLLAAINAFYVLLGIVGLLRWRQVHSVGMLAAFVLLRTVIITAVTFPEPRYVLECFPALIVLGAAGLGLRSQRRVAGTEVGLKMIE
jgi:hypothetical protein